VLFYAAGEAIQGVATGVLVEHANDVPAGQREAAADAAQALYDASAGELLIGVGAVAWVRRSSPQRWPTTEWARLSPFSGWSR
jgi:hypothetical protein